IVGQLKNAGYEVVAWEAEADLYLVHTCAVTQQAVAKSRQQIHQAHHRNEQAQIVVMGCYAQLEPETIAAMPGVKFIVGTADRLNLLQQLKEEEQQTTNQTVVSLVRPFEKKESFEELPGSDQAHYSRPMIKIQEGCNNYCSYCIIPYLRGPERSRELRHIVQEATALAGQGYSEVVLTGINLSSWGRDFTPKSNLTQLLKILAKVEGLQRLRISSIEPLDVSEEFIDFVASEPKFCRHLHIPLQSGSDGVLQRMNRHYDTAYYRQLITQLRSRLPGLALTTDLIVGFPGETEEEAAETYAFCQEMQFSRMHVFRYSARKGTPAAARPDQIKKEIQEARSKQIRILAEQMAAAYAKTFVGKELQVLLEENSNCNGFAEGYSDEYLRVKVAFEGKPGKGGELVTVRIKSLRPRGLAGVVIQSL
ncbi:MAG TPA: tRNA (N(6)-L-threonylcarbamoyladenosine(37)-C(2))-methylthiotransferase MtaB, partial [Bacillota bacterium]|nr:tRNA (N(6)-L-threonylcarbamoyladenosine(37)-C(2))-methylthiotransferase MtaB [Bacillota bacterium]